MLTKFPKDGDVWACWDVRMVGATQAVDASGRAKRSIAHSA